MKLRSSAVLATVLVLAVIAAVAYVLVRDRRPSAQTPSTSSSSVLALTWGPSLCKVERTASGCRSGNVDRRGQSLLLHGLWPQPSTEQYCEVSQHDAARRSVELPTDVRKTLETMMSDAKVMAPHEWYAHGSCSGVTPTEYFTISATLTEQATTLLNPVFARSQGRQLDPKSVREVLDAKFGRGAGQRAGLSCRNRDGGGPLVYELRLSLPAVVELRGQTSLGDALAKGPAIPAGCGKGKVP